MTKAFKYLSYMLVGAAVATTAWSCSDEDYTMPQPNITPAELVEGVAFTVEHDAQNPNIIHLTSLMPQSYQVAWVTPQGRKTGATATLSIPFDGTYEVQMGVDTRGGYVWSEPYAFTIDEFCADFVDHYLWKRISGGVGQSKTWQLDLSALLASETDENAIDKNTWVKTSKDGVDYWIKTTKFNGPHWFFNSGYTWDHLHATNENETTYANFIDSDPWDKANAINTASVPETSAGANNADWYWAADYAGNNWMCAAQNYGYITFDLINGANVTVTDADGNVVGKGTYMLDTEDHTLTLSDVYPLETTDTRTHERFLKLLYLSDDALMVMAPSEGVALNYVTKEYFENFTKPAPSVITLPDGWYEALAPQLKFCSWTLDPETPFDFYDLGGNAKNGYTQASDYDAQFPLVSTTIDEFKLNMCDPEPGKYSVAMPDADPLMGDVVLNAAGTVTFSNGLGDLPLGGTAVKLEGTTLNVISLEYAANGSVDKLVLGVPQRDINGTVYEYIGYKLIADYGVEKAETYKAYVCFNNTGDWTMLTGNPVFAEEGRDYTATLDVEWQSAWGDPCLWLDVEKLLKAHPQCDVILKDIKIDGTSIAFDDAAISRSAAGDADPDINHARRYICNPWGLASCFSGFEIFHPKKNVEVTFTLIFENGEPFVK